MKKYWHRFIAYLDTNFQADKSRLIAWIPFLFATGIAIYFALPFEPNYWLSLSILEIWLLLFYLLRHHNIHLFFTAVLLVICGFINIQLHTIYAEKKVSFYPERQTYLTGRIIDITYSEKGRKRLLLDDVSDYDKPLKGLYRITSMNNDDFQINQCVELTGTVFPPRQLPILNGFSLDRKYLYAGISAIGYSESEIFTIDCPQEHSNSRFKAALNKVRHQIITDIDNTLLPNKAGIIDAILVGEQSHIPPTVKQNYRNSGLAHFLSVSGLHLGTISGLIFFVFRFLISLFPFLAIRFESKKIASVLAIIISYIYLLVSGQAIPAQRAFIMTTVVFIGILFNRQAVSMRMVSLAAFVVLLLSPDALISISFQMSFAAVFALISSYESYGYLLKKLNYNRHLLHRLFVYLLGIIVCDLVASLATTPFAIYHFHRIALYTSLGNLLAGPLIGFWLMPAILLCLISLPLGLSYYPILILGSGIDILNRITEFVSSLPHSVLTIYSMPFYSLILIIIGAYWLCVWQQSWRKWGLILILSGIFPLFFTTQPDIVYAENGQGIALKDNQNKLQLLPLKIDNWTRKIWRENLPIEQLSTFQKREIQDIYDGNKTNKQWLDLECSQESCLYKSQIEILKNGTIKIKEKQIDNQIGGYIYLNNDKIKIKPFYNPNHQRKWNKIQEAKDTK